ncbi:C25 family cysteine peptidase [Candidatus Margulisiibacteriota bacterium]
MKNLIPKIALIFLLVTGINAANIEYTFSFSDPQIIQKGDFQQIELTEATGITGEPGSPMLPIKMVYLLLPPNSKVTNVSVQNLSSKTFQNITPLPVPTPIPTNRTYNLQSTTYNPSYPSTTYPTDHYQNHGTQYKRDYILQAIQLNPCQINPSSKELILHTKMKVIISYTTQMSISSYGSATPEMRDEVEELVDNPSVVSQYDQQMKIKSTGAEYVIITNQTLKPAFEELKSWKEAKGLTTKIITIQEIVDNYSGVDTQEKIRNYIKANKATIQYVLLGGDIAIVPARIMWGAPIWNNRELYSDMYYANLDGTFDSNGDRKYGDITSDTNIDFLNDVKVGRFPVTTVDEAQKIIEKIIYYESHPQENHIKDLALVGEVMKEQNGDKSYSDGSKIDEYNIVNSNSPLFQNKIRIFANPANQREFATTQQNITNVINNGVEYITHMGHGSPTSVMLYGNSDVNNLQNENNYFAIISQACEAGSYTTDSIAKAFIKKEKAGAFAVMMNANVGWYYPAFGTNSNNYLPLSDRYSHEFIKQLSIVKARNIGKAFYAAKDKVVKDNSFNQYYVWAYFESNLLGDPETTIYTFPGYDVPQINISYQTAQGYINGETPVHISLSGASIKSGAVVKLQTSTDNKSWVTNDEEPAGNTTLNIQADNYENGDTVYVRGIYCDPNQLTSSDEGQAVIDKNAPIITEIVTPTIFTHMPQDQETVHVTINAQDTEAGLDTLNSKIYYYIATYPNGNDPITAKTQFGSITEGGSILLSWEHYSNKYLIIEVNVHDVIGNNATEVYASLIIDDTVYEPPVIAEIPETSSPLVTVNGTTEGLVSVNIYAGGVLKAQTKADAGGNFSKQILIDKDSATIFTRAVNDHNVESHDSNYVTVVYQDTEYNVAQGDVNITITIPFGATTINEEIVVQTNEDLGDKDDLPRFKYISSLDIDFVNHEGEEITFLHPISITLTLDTNISSKTAIRYWNGTEWTDAGISNIQVQGNTITFSTTHLSTYGIFAPASSEIKMTKVTNFPNPADENGTTFYCELTNNTSVTITLYSLQGKKIETLKFNGVAGVNRFLWNDSKFRKLGNGVYLYVVSTGSEKEAKKLVIVK